MMEIAASHVQFGCVHGNLMIDLAAPNEELRDRAARLLIANPGLRLRNIRKFIPERHNTGMKCVPLIILLAICRVAFAQTPELKADESIPIPKVTFNDKGDFVLKAPPSSSASDFDFLVGKWRSTIFT
ncbi:MAG: hypothetical protein ABI196_13695 [Bradyrhizobium sp.]